MANFCGYRMKVQGKPENVDEFVKVIQCHYDYDINEFSFERHFWRVFNADVDTEEVENDIKTVMIDGDCAWSVVVCMLKELNYQISYSPEQFSRLGQPKGRGTNIVEESKNLHLAIEIYSSEDSFQEHYVAVNGELLVEDCVDYSSVYWDKNEHPTLDDFNESYETDYTEDLFDQDGYAEIGGYEWEFGDYTKQLILNN